MITSESIHDVFTSRFSLSVFFHFFFIFLLVLSLQILVSDILAQITGVYPLYPVSVMKLIAAAALCPEILPLTLYIHPDSSPQEKSYK